MLRNILTLLALGAAISAFSQEADADSVTLDTIKVTAHAGKPPYQPSATLEWDIIHTRIALSFDFMQRTAAAREWVTMRPWMYTTDTVVLDAQSMRIDSVMLVEKKQTRALRFAYADDMLKIWFDRKYTARDTVNLYFRYTAMPYATKSEGSAAITDSKGLYFINTDGRIPNKPMHIWTQGETEANSHWMITIDKPNTRFTTQLELTVPDSLTTLSNGALVKKIKGLKGMRTDIWKIDKPIQAYAVMLAIGKYSVIKDSWKGKEVSYYVEPAYAKYARNMFLHTTDMMDFFSKRTGVSYPWNKYSQVAVRDYVSGAMENTTASLFGEFIDQTDREIADKDYEDIVSHELFHQWFGDYVTCESWANTTVNESFANYGEQLWRTYKYGKTSGEELAWTDLQLYIASSRASDPQLVRYNYDSREQLFDAISYNKGGATLRYMNYLMGDEAFDKAMNIYLTRNALQPAEAHHWRLAVEEATGQDWNWFFNEWYFHAGHPVLKINYDYDDAAQMLTVNVTQAQKDTAFDYVLPLRTEVIYGTDVSVTDWKIDAHTQTFTYPYRNGQKPVIVPDMDHVLPGEIKEDKKPEQWLTQYVASKGYISKKLAIAGAAKHFSDSATQVVIDMALHDTLYLLRKATLQKIEKLQRDKYRRRWASTVLEMATNDGNRHVRAAAFDVLAAWKSKTAMEAALTAIWDSSYLVAGSALELVDKLDADTALILARKLPAKEHAGALETAIWKIIGKNGADADIQLYEQRVPHVLGTDKISYAISLGSYLKNVADTGAFTRGISLYGTMIDHEEMKAYRSALAGFFLQTVAEQKGMNDDEDAQSAARAQAHIRAIVPVLKKLAASESDEETKEKLEKAMNEINEKG